MWAAAILNIYHCDQIVIGNNGIRNLLVFCCFGINVYHYVFYVREVFLYIAVNMLCNCVGVNQSDISLNGNLQVYINFISELPCVKEVYAKDAGLL